MERKRGRPAYKPTKQVRENVEMFLSCGMTNEQIATAIGVSHVTFAKAFADEIQNGRGRARARILGWLQKSARSGNVTAQKKLEEMSRLTEAAASFEQQVAPARGKKEVAQQEAADTLAGTSEWGDDLNPNSIN